MWPAQIRASGYNENHVIESTGSMSAAPAASSDRIAVYYKGSRQAVVISPDDRTGFIDLVKAINPDITLRL